MKETLRGDLVRSRLRVFGLNIEPVEVCEEKLHLSDALGLPKELLASESGLNFDGETAGDCEATGKAGSFGAVGVRRLAIEGGSNVRDLRKVVGWGEGVGVNCLGLEKLLLLTVAELLQLAFER